MNCCGELGLLKIKILELHARTVRLLVTVQCQEQEQFYFLIALKIESLRSQY